MSEAINLIPVERIERAILLLRGEKVMLDSDLAELKSASCAHKLNNNLKSHDALAVQQRGHFCFLTGGGALSANPNGIQIHQLRVGCPRRTGEERLP